MQFLLTGAIAGERVLYISLSETREEVEEVARSHGWPLDLVEIVELSAIDQQLAAQSQNTLFHSSEVELTETTSMLLDAVDRVKPTRVAFDSLSDDVFCPKRRCVTAARSSLPNNISPGGIARHFSSTIALQKRRPHTC
ncbi:hypothetical protein BH18VER1_BH18VER1_21030 [soil metagenome]